MKRCFSFFCFESRCPPMFRFAAGAELGNMKERGQRVMALFFSSLRGVQECFSTLLLEVEGEHVSELEWGRKDKDVFFVR